MLAQPPQLDKIASHQAFACSALRRAGAREDKGVVLGNGANLAEAGPKGPPLRAMLNT
jgi:hypothetical protein